MREKHRFTAPQEKSFPPLVILLSVLDGESFLMSTQFMAVTLTFLYKELRSEERVGERGQSCPSPGRICLTSEPFGV